MYGPVREGINHNLVIALIDAEGRLIQLETGSAAQSSDSAELLSNPCILTFQVHAPMRSTQHLPN